MVFQIRKASRKQSKLRIGLSGTSGSGKTYSALKLAYGICGNWEKIALIDTENGSGDLYSHLGQYNIITLIAPFSPERYIEAIKACEDAGMEVIIIDSISHEWEGKGGCLEINDMIANTKFKGNTWSAWSVTTPRHQKFIEKIIQSSCHIITTVRNKVDMAMVDNKPKKVGTKEITREGFEYELTVNFTIERDSHLATASKDRTDLFERDPFLLDEKIGEEIKNWNLKGEVGETYTDIVNNEKLKQVQEKKTNPKTDTIPPVASAEATPVQTERFLIYQELFGVAVDCEELNKLGKRLKGQIAIDGSYITKAQLLILVELKNKKEAELQDKIETEKITPLVASAEATTEEVKLAGENITKADEITPEEQVLPTEIEEEVCGELNIEDVEAIFDNESKNE